MEVRGERECQDCGARWSYYETGSVACPECGSVHSVGVEDDRRLHTDVADELDVTRAREAAAERPLAEAAAVAADCVREYVRNRGFVVGGDLRNLDDEYLVAVELRHAAGVLERAAGGRGLGGGGAAERALDSGEDEELYFVRLLRAADGDADRPAPDEVPAALRDARGLAYANAVRAYRRDVSAWLDASGAPPGAGDALERLGEHVKRVRALDGSVEPQTAESLVRAARELADYVRDGDEAAFDAARDRLDRL
jgi:hypothetical protein